MAYLSSADVVRKFAQALDADALELLELASKLPPELDSRKDSSNARRFIQRASAIAPSEDWDAMLDFLEQRQAERARGGEDS